jgi:cation diffusion facilitator CzcD-associated flavoprotein CzcO
MSVNSADSDTEAKGDSVDAVVVGAGFSGLYMTYRLRTLGLSVRSFEAGHGVGGTWFWNRYPGARTDSESSFYAYKFSEALQDEWDWKEKFPAQSEMLEYLQHVADRFDLGRHYTFNSIVSSAVFDEEAGLWDIRTNEGDHLRAKYFVSCVGVLSAANRLSIDGLADFKGESVYTASWPEGGVDFAGKRVAIIGTGSSGVQLTPEVAKTAAKLVVFQRTPNYVVPSVNAELDDSKRAAIRDERDETQRRVRTSAFAMPYQFTGRLALDFPEDERRQIFEEAWAKGGFRFMIESFDDITSDKAANDTASEFIRGKIKEIVKDPATAESLCPSYPYGVKRPPSGNGYYEAFNQENVELVDVRTTPIVAITENGLRTQDREFDFDILVYATGFDAVTGSIVRMDIRGRGNVVLADKWKAGPRTYLAMSVHEFPNFFMVGGPHYAGGNFPTVVEENTDWIAGLIEHAERTGAARIEATRQAEEEWTNHTNEVAEQTLIPAYGREAHSYNFGANVDGKTAAINVYLGGAQVFFDRCDAVAANGYEGFDLA